METKFQPILNNISMCLNLYGGIFPRR